MSAAEVGGGERAAKTAHIDVACRECGGYVLTQFARVCKECLDD